MSDPAAKRSAVHTIRLRSAWTTDGEGSWRRRFHRPTGLDRGERVWIAWRGDLASATLNGDPLLATATRAEVTGRLAPSNELVFVVDNPELLETVRLEIEEAPDGSG